MDFARHANVCQVQLRPTLCASRNHAQNYSGMDIGLVIRRKRQAKGWNLAELAHAADTDAGNISRIERGKQACSQEMLDKIAKALGVKISQIFAEAEGGPEPFIFSPGLPTVTPINISATLKRAPVVGTTQGGPEAFHEELGYPVGIGDGYLDNPTEDPNAYGLRVKGTSMAPRMREGDAILVSPNETVEPGDDVVVRFKDGEVMVKQLVYMRGGEVALDSVSDDARIVRKLEDIEFMHYVAGIYPPKSIKYK